MGFPTNPEESRGQPCRPCPCNTGSNQAPVGAAPSPAMPPVGTQTVDTRFKLNNEISDYRAHSECIRLPLKSGGFLSLRWNQFPGLSYSSVSPMEPDDWEPGGHAGTFSFMPYLARASVPESAPSTYERLSGDGMAHYQTVGRINSGTTYYTYYEVAGMPYKARHNSVNNYFTEYDSETQVYYQFAGYGHDWYGRPLRRWDRNGNELLYQYSNRQGSPAASLKPILRKITGDVSGVVPYFSYRGATNEEQKSSPISKVFLLGQTASDDRVAYFDYVNNIDAGNVRLKQITNPSGCVTQFRLSTSGSHIQIDKEVDADGYTTYFVYGRPLGGYLGKVVEPEGRVTYYEYTTANKTGYIPLDRPTTYYEYVMRSGTFAPYLRRLRDALNNRTYYTYDSGDRVIRKLEANGNTTYYEFNSQEAPSKTIRAADGATTEHAYEANAQDLHKTLGPRHVAGTFAVVTYYEYDGLRNRIAVTDALGNKTQSPRDSAGRVRKTQDARSNTTYYSYNGTSGSLDSVFDADKKVAYFKYNSYRDRIREVSPRWTETGAYKDFTTYHEYDSVDRRRKSVDPLNNVTYFDWTSRGDLDGVTDARGVVTDYTYTGLRQLRKRRIQDAAGATVQTQYFEYDVYKNRVGETDALGNRTYFMYDALDRVRAVRDALLNRTYFAYDSVSNRRKAQDARLNTAYFNYDLLSRLKSSRDALGNEAYFFYDLADNRTKVRDARLNTSYFFYDQLDRVNASRDALGNYAYFFYDAVSNRTRVRDARLNTAYFFYDALNRQRTVRDALANSTYFFYDAAGNPTRVRNPRLNTAYFFYDALDRRKTTRDALANFAYFFYDAVGNTTRVRDARLNTAYFFYDALSRQKTIRDALANFTYFFYDAQGNATRARDARLNTAYFFYDALNRPKAARDALANIAYFGVQPAA